MLQSSIQVLLFREDPVFVENPSLSIRLSHSIVAFAILAALVALVATPAPLHAESPIPRTPSPEGARVYIISPADGDQVTSPVMVRFGLSQMGVAPAGVLKDATGHHHLVIDADLPPNHLPIPKSDHYKHFGKGQTEVQLELSPGEHTLQLVLGDHLHIPHDPPVVSERITITVK